MQIEYVPVGKIKPYSKNAKKHPVEQVEHIANSIREFGFKQPLVIDKDGVLVIGHGRLLAAKRLGMTEVPCVRADDLTDEQIKALRLADNKTNESEWDIGLLAEDLESIIDIDMEQFGFDAFELDDGAGGAADSAEIVENNVPEISETRCKLGDIWQLGEHRLMCGDSTDAEEVDTLIKGARINLVLTDPPYGVNIVQNAKVGGDKPFGRTRGDGGGVVKLGATRGEAKNAILKAKLYMPIKGDDTTETAERNYEIVKERSDAQIIFGGNYFTDFLPPSRCWLVWDKQVPKEAFFSPVEFAWCSKDANSDIYHYLWSGICRKGDRETEGKTRMHPTQKPVGMHAEILKDFSEEGDTVLDGFGGSGSTLIACEQTSRICFMMECEPYYCDVIIQRWENFTGEKAVLLNGETS